MALPTPDLPTVSPTVLQHVDVSWSKIQRKLADFEPAIVFG
jgi:hypothetical protein